MFSSCVLPPGQGEKGEPGVISRSDGTIIAAEAKGEKV